MIVLMMGAGSISETLVNFYQTTRRCNPEDRTIFILVTMRLSNLTKEGF
jgi:hypothetical protein